MNLNSEYIGGKMRSTFLMAKILKDKGCEATIIVDQNYQAFGVCLKNIFYVLVCSFTN